MGKYSEEYCLPEHYEEVEPTGENLYDFLSSIKSNNFNFEVFKQIPKWDFQVCGIVYKECNDVETFSKTLKKLRCTDVWKCFKFYSQKLECETYRFIIGDKNAKVESW